MPEEPMCQHANQHANQSTTKCVGPVVYMCHVTGMVLCLSVCGLCAAHEVMSSANISVLPATNALACTPPGSGPPLQAPLHLSADKSPEPSQRLLCVEVHQCSSHITGLLHHRLSHQQPHQQPRSCSCPTGSRSSWYPNITHVGQQSCSFPSHHHLGCVDEASCQEDMAYCTCIGCRACMHVIVMWE